MDREGLLLAIDKTEHLARRFAGAGEYEDWMLLARQIDEEIDRLITQMEKQKKFSDFQPLLALAKGFELILSTAYTMENEIETEILQEKKA